MAVEHSLEPLDGDGDPRFLARIAQTFLVDGGLAIVGFGTGILEARALGPSGLRDFALLTTALTLLAAAAQTGLAPSTVFFSSRVPERSLTPNVLMLGGVLGCAGAGLLGAAVAMGANPFHMDRSLLILGSLTFPFVLLSSAGLAVVHGRYRMTRYQVVRSTPVFANLPLLGIALLLTDDRVFGFSLAWAVSQVVATVVAVKAALVGSHEWRPDLSLWRRVLAFGARTHVGSLLKYLQYRVDILIVGVFLSRSDVGLYVVAIAMAEIPWRIPSAVGTVLFPRLAAARSDEEKYGLTPVVARHTVFLSAAVALALGVTAPIFVRFFYGQQYAGAVPAALILLPGVVLLALWKILAQDLIAQGRPNAYSISAGASLVLLVIACPLLAPALGVEGGALASSLSYALATAIMLHRYSRLTGNSIRSTSLVSSSDLAAYLRLVRRAVRRLRRGDLDAASNGTE